MSALKELLIDILKLTDEVKRLNQSVVRLQDHVMDVDKRLVRLETLVEVAMMRPVQPEIRQIEDDGDE